MKRTHVYCFALWVVLCGTAGCSLPEGDRDACTHPSDCLDGYVCNMQSAHCEIETETCSGGPAECGDETVLLAGQGDLRELIVDETHLYWIESRGVDSLGNGLPARLQRMPVHGGAVETLADLSEEALDLVVDETHIYWASGDGVHRFDKLGGGVPELFVPSDARPRGLMLDTTRIYYKANPDTVQAISKTDGSSTEWTFEGVSEFTVADRFLYVFAGAYQRVALDGATPAEVLVSRAEPSYWDLRHHGGYLYVTDPLDNVLQLDVEDLGSRVVLRRDGVGSVSSLVLDGGELFASSEEADVDSIVRASAVNPAPHTEVWRSPIGRGDSGNKSLSVAVDADYIYWADGYSGTIHRAPR